MVRVSCVVALGLTVLLSGCLWRVIDGDSVELTVYSGMAPIQYRLHGIDAPERHQKCRTWGATWDCGLAATAALETRIQGMVCSGNETDGYGRTVGVCLQGTDDLNAWMVAQGWALAYREFSDDYADEEAEAKSAKRGIHKGQFVNPWDWRRGERLPDEDNPSTFDWMSTGYDVDVGLLAANLLLNQPVDFDGGFLEHAAFGITNGEAVSFGDFRDVAPAGIGRVVWTGQAIAVDGAGAVSRGTSMVDIDDLAAPDVDVVLSGLPQDFTWTDAPLDGGLFDAPDGSMWGGFFGPEQEEVGGVFERAGLTGAFGGGTLKSRRFLVVFRRLAERDRS